MTNEVGYKELCNLEDYIEENLIEILDEYVNEELLEYSTFMLDSTYFDREQLIKLLKISMTLEKLNNGSPEISIFIKAK